MGGSRGNPGHSGFGPPVKHSDTCKIWFDVVLSEKTYAASPGVVQVDFRLGVWMGIAYTYLADEPTKGDLRWMQLIKPDFRIPQGGWAWRDGQGVNLGGMSMDAVPFLPHVKRMATLIGFPNSPRPGRSGPIRFEYIGPREYAPLPSSWWPGQTPALATPIKSLTQNTITNPAVGTFGETLRRWVGTGTWSIGEAAWKPRSQNFKIRMLGGVGGGGKGGQVDDYDFEIWDVDNNRHAHYTYAAAGIGASFIPIQPAAPTAGGPWNDFKTPALYSGDEFSGAARLTSLGGGDATWNKFCFGGLINSAGDYLVELDLKTGTTYGRRRQRYILGRNDV